MSKTKKNIFICHHDDDDGIMGGSIFKYFYYNAKNLTDVIGDITCIELNYEMLLSNIESLNNVKDNDLVIFVDYSFAPTATENIAFLKHLIDEVKCGVVWIDHHISSIKTVCMEENSWMRHIEGALTTKYCGAMLAYWYLQDNFTYLLSMTIDEIGNLLAEIIGDNYDNTPIVLRFIDDYDCWKHNYEHTTDLFHTGLNLSYDQKDFVDNAIKYIYSNEAKGENGKVLLSSIISLGLKVKPFNEKRNRIEMKNAFECKIPGWEQYSVLACNSSTFSSLLFGDRINDYDIVCVFRFLGDKFRYSLYTVKVDVMCNEIAESFGGGGHPGAAGFNIPTFLFSK